MEVIESGSQLRLSPFRLQAASDTLVEVITALHFRARELDGKGHFMSHLDSERSVRLSTSRSVGIYESGDCHEFSEHFGTKIM